MKTELKTTLIPTTQQDPSGSGPIDLFGVCAMKRRAKSGIAEVGVGTIFRWQAVKLLLVVFGGSKVLKSMRLLADFKHDETRFAAVHRV